MVQLNQFANEIENAKSGSQYAQVPSGDYVVACVGEQEKQNSKKTGHYIQLDFEIQEGEFMGEKLVDRINHDNPNETARNIAWGTLKQLGQAIDQHPLPSTEALLGKRLIAKVKNKQSDRPIEDDNGNQKFDDNGNPMFYRDISIAKYQPYSMGSQQPSASPANGQVSTNSNNGSFPFPK